MWVMIHMKFILKFDMNLVHFHIDWRENKVICPEDSIARIDHWVNKTGKKGEILMHKLNKNQGLYKKFVEKHVGMFFRNVYLRILYLKKNFKFVEI